VRFLKHFSNSVDSYIRQQSASNSDSPNSILEKLAKDPDDFVRLAVANNPSTSEITLAELSSDTSPFNGNPDIQLAVFHNPNTSQEIVDHLAEVLIGMGDKWFRRTVAASPDTPTHILTQLASDSELFETGPDIQIAVYHNPNTPTMTRLQLEKSLREYINEPPHWLIQLDQEREQRLIDWRRKQYGLQRPKTLTPPRLVRRDDREH